MVDVAVVMGSRSDLETMQESIEILKRFSVSFHAQVLSAHRTPLDMIDFAKQAKTDGYKVIIAGAGGAAHLPGMIASCTVLPVIGVPVQSRALNGMDSLLSIVQMPGGIPVATTAIGTAGAKNAGLLAVSILALSDPDLSMALSKYREELTRSVRDTKEIERCESV